MKIATAQNMKNIDERAIHQYLIPSILLMENAGLKTAEYIKTTHISSGKVGIFCGKGNNGGDGFVITRHLFNYGYAVTVFRCFEYENTLPVDAQINYDILLKMGITICEPNEIVIDKCDLLIDAIFGVGLTGAVREGYAKFIRLINNSGKKVISIDLPSGACADTGIVLGECVRADITVTYSLFKKCFFLYPSKEFAGEVVRLDISIPKMAIEDENININLIDREMANALLPKHSAFHNKGDFGKVLMVCGSVGMGGAGYLASSSAMRCGSGLVTLCVPNSIASAMEAKTTEVMTLGVPDFDGIVSSEAFDIIFEKAKNVDVILFGCGLGRNENVDILLAKILDNIDKPIVIDADGLFSLSKNIEILRNKKVVILPHNMEMARLIGKDVQYVVENSFTVAKELADEYNITVVLKGPNTIVCSNGNTFVNTSGSNNLASGGTGDVLAGIVTSLIGQGLSLTDASVLGVFAHGFCGDILKERLGFGTIATDLIDTLPEAFKLIK